MLLVPVIVIAYVPVGAFEGTEIERTVESAVPL